MRYCKHCGAEINEEAVICITCGCSVVEQNEVVAQNNDDGLTIASKIFLILGCVAQGFLIIPLAWCLPITISIWGKIKRNEPIGTGLKVCTLLLVNTIAGILLLCRSEKHN